MRESFTVQGVRAALAFAAGSTLLVVAAVTATATNAVFDASAFAAGAAASLDDPAVADALAEAITGAVLAESPDLSSVRPLLLMTARSLVQLEPTRALVQTSARSAHQAFFAEGTQQVLLSVPDMGVILRAALAQGSPELAEKIPDRLQAGLASYDGRQVIAIMTSAWGIRNTLRLIIWLLIPLGAGLLIVGVRLAPNSYEGVSAAGLFLAGAGLVVMALIPLGSLAIGWLASSGGEQAAVQGLWRAFMAPLTNLGFFLSGVGLLVTAAGLSLQEVFDPRDWARRIGHRLVVAPEAKLARALWATGMLGAGGFLIAQPGAAIAIATVILGMAMALLGAYVIFQAVLEKATDQPAVPVRTEGRVYLRVALMTVLVLGAVGLLALLRSPVPPPPPPTVTTCNGHTELCDRAISEVVFAGAHNAMSNASIPDWMFPHHENSILTQAERGVRAFLIDVHYGFAGGARIKTDMSGPNSIAEAAQAVLGAEGVEAAQRIRERLVGVDEGTREVYLCHGLCELGGYRLEPTLADLRDFLVQNPGEVLILVIEDYVTPADIATAFETSGLMDYVYTGELGSDEPTLQELIYTGGKVVVFLESGTPGVPWLRPAFDIIEETPYTFHTVDEFNCDPNRGGTGKTFFQINHWIETTPTPLPSNAAMVNAYDVLLGRAQQCQEERGKLPNILAVDHYAIGDLMAVVEALNGFDQRSTPDEP